eukprot:TRINITY_DN46674_c0_g1_i1.p1 TRINITY_DN46674_c0_g1~~TRINITY_DN46674_c0_g1_i1.p1  ORF type:complete len:550 (-),score=88.70 TRINITY_DN46674_c0_g1_i1:60-1646(-)
MRPNPSASRNVLHVLFALSLLALTLGLSTDKHDVVVDAGGQVKKQEHKAPRATREFIRSQATSHGSSSPGRSAARKLEPVTERLVGGQEEAAAAAVASLAQTHAEDVVIDSDGSAPHAKSVLDRLVPHHGPGPKATATGTGGGEGGQAGGVHVDARSVMFVYPMTLFVEILLIAAMYYQQGGVIVAKVVGYLIALSSMKLTVKYLYVEYDFSYPKFVTCAHLLFSCVAGFLVTIQQTKGAKRLALELPSRHLLEGIVPCAIAFSLTLALNNIALMLCSTSFTEIIGATNPIVTVVFVIGMGMPFSLSLLGPVILVAFGSMLSAYGELKFSMVGTILCFAANAARALRTAMAQKLLTVGEETLEPCALMAWTCAVSCVIMFLWSLATEGSAPWTRMVSQVAVHHHVGLWVSLLVSCLNACALNLAQLTVTRDLGAVGSTVVAQLKTIATVIGGMTFFGDTFTLAEYIGFACVLLGAAVFSRMQQQEKAHAREQQRPPPISPPPRRPMTPPLTSKASEALCAHSQPTTPR